MGWYSWAPYVPVAERRRRAEAAMKKMLKKGEKFEPVQPAGRAIATTFWGKAWCENLERYSDYENRLPRGRAYVRRGAVVDLKILKGELQARVSGTSLYKIRIRIAPVPRKRWEAIKSDCAGRIGSAIELLRGRLAEAVMGVITRQETGLFPSPKEIKLDCSCPDWADMCKHVAAVLYGVGTRLDEKPELLFLLRGVDHLELVAEAGQAAARQAGAAAGAVDGALSDDQVADVFGIDIEAAAPVISTPPSAAAPALKSKRVGRRVGKAAKELVVVVTPKRRKTARAKKSVRTTRRQAKRKAHIG